MTGKKGKGTKGRQRVGQSILWAAALIGSALILQGTEQADKIFWLLLILATTSVLLHGGTANDRCLWRKLTGRGRE